MKKSTSLLQDAIRMLYILVHGSEEFSDRDKPEIKGIFRGKARLYAMDFWVRYPDYFAHELLILYDETKELRYLNLAKEIFENREPDLRQVPMIRYMFGAYEDLNNILSILVSKGLIKQTGLKSKDHIQQHNYLIYDIAYTAIDQANDKFPILKWYEDRTKIITEIVGTRGGSALKLRQYEHIEYAQTKLGGIIPSIKREVQNRIEETQSFLYSEAR
ncbi:MAG: hypothetical protein PF693_03345 [Spirochaetia bacterium]|jgi:hypothetical protein|nr:hypothetical protein [Spirochaetia bacterium]